MKSNYKIKVKKFKMNRKPITIKAQIFSLMVLIVAFQAIALITGLITSQIFLKLDSESFRLFNSAVEARSQWFNKTITNTVGNVVIEAENLGEEIGRYIEERVYNEGYTEEEIHHLENSALDSVLSLLKSNNITGAYVILDKKYKKNIPDSDYPVIYVKDTTTSSDNAAAELHLEKGPIGLSYEHDMALGKSWDTSIDMDLLEENNFYFAPYRAAMDFPKSELVRYGYWGSPANYFGSNNKMITYSLPILDSQGLPCGVIGIEISLYRFTNSYLPSDDIPYHNSFYAIVKNRSSGIDLNWYIPSGPLAQVYLKDTYWLEAEPVGVGNLLRTWVKGLGEAYCSVNDINIYSKNSPFYNDRWSLAAFVSKEELHSNSSETRTLLIGSVIASTLLSLMGIVILTYYSGRKVKTLSDSIESMDLFKELDIAKTGLKEIDELTEALQTVNKRVVNSAKITGKIMELTNMPLGCYEVTDEKSTVDTTTYIKQILNIKEDQELSKEEWEDYYKEMTKLPYKGYSDVYCHINPKTGEKVWIKINESETISGKVGTVMDVTEDIEMNLRLLRELEYDSLTGLLNREAFKEKTRLAIERDPYSSGAMIFVDLDNLKYVNDTYGHDIGDGYLIEAGKLFNGFSDYGAIVARISGDEFAIYLHGYNDSNQLRSVVEEQFKINHKYVITLPNGKKQQIRYSGGVAFYPNDANNVDGLLKFSDYAMYEAKRKKKGFMLYFNKDSYMDNIYLLSSNEDINVLIEEEMVRLVFQPIIDLEKKVIFGYEVLMRPTHISFDSPMKVLKAAEAQFKINQLETMLMNKSIKYVHDHKEKFKDKKVFINSVTNQKLSDEDFSALEDKYGDIFENLVIEFIENENVSQEIIKSKVDLIRKSGMKVAIDDFGAGFSNELQVLSLNPDIIKIDMSIIRDVDKDSRKQHFVDHILSFSRDRGIKVIAEGVETVEELEHLREKGVDYIQGYLLGKPDAEIKDLAPEVLEILKA